MTSKCGEYNTVAKEAQLSASLLQTKRIWNTKRYLHQTQHCRSLTKKSRFTEIRVKKRLIVFSVKLEFSYVSILTSEI